MSSLLRVETTAASASSSLSLFQKSSNPASVSSTALLSSSVNSFPVCVFTSTSPNSSCPAPPLSSVVSCLVSISITTVCSLLSPFLLIFSFPWFVSAFRVESFPNTPSCPSSLSSIGAPTSFSSPFSSFFSTPPSFFFDLIFTPKRVSPFLLATFPSFISFSLSSFTLFLSSAANELSSFSFFSPSTSTWSPPSLTSPPQNPSSSFHPHTFFLPSFTSSSSFFFSSSSLILFSSSSSSSPSSPPNPSNPCTTDLSNFFVFPSPNDFCRTSSGTNHPLPQSPPSPSPRPSSPPPAPIPSGNPSNPSNPSL
eukprot:comp23679_c1_seq1/m.40555 comp23679_c1_seq1/g.40555  ORF comp23679_c1_seq1/g.40555 comp23679_c1_seq1/m.40555 type:complete len:309 (+) comp23679_c1_seq1:1422-2348(+)